MIEYNIRVYKNDKNELDRTEWRLPNGLLHREDGPAVENASGVKVWYKNGQLHREGGPAVEWSGSIKHWYLNNILYSEQDYNAEMVKRNKKTCPTDEIIKIGTKKYKLVEVK